MSLTTLELLAKPQSDAVNDMVQSALRETVSLDDLVIEDGFVKSDGRTGMAVTASPARLADPQWPYFGTAVFSHRRMDLGDFFRNLPLKLLVPPSTSGGIDITSNEVVSMLSDIFQIHFDAQDYYSDQIQSVGATVYTLKATPMSLRWKGSVDIQLFPDIAGGAP